MSNKIAIFGGSFNPIHLGHIKIAYEVMHKCDMSKVIFLPNAHPPHKNTWNIVSPQDRYNMVCLAIEDIACFDICDYEMNSMQPSYTIDTMRYMKSLYSEELYFVIGADSLYTLNKWKSYDDLIRECKFIVADRNCDEGNDINKAINLHISSGGYIKRLPMEMIDITSSMIREYILHGKDVSVFLPDKVNEYIIANKLYQ